MARKDDLRLTKMMMTIFLCFLMSFLPLMIVNVADDEVRVPSVHVVASVLAWASAVVNPFVYAVTNRQYRTAYRTAYRRLCLRRWGGVWGGVVVAGRGEYRGCGDRGRGGDRRRMFKLVTYIHY
ncbi:hypothetical protein Pmani_033947 [Petrolisthes manimaculis]|uniref:G-protein coupled receptors family 1 profile domain-containing protein n=1 Tax=Petrolisthes manimaculis TaxID=1843537 RepID=A0AAE1NQ95_9EUCA|nr:hypothetical protein Pmani_033947 [Petrolisthes manimaculis]